MSIRSAALCGRILHKNTKYNTYKKARMDKQPRYRTLGRVSKSFDPVINYRCISRNLLRPESHLKATRTDVSSSMTLSGYKENTKFPAVKASLLHSDVRQRQTTSFIFDFSPVKSTEKLSSRLSEKLRGRKISIVAMRCSRFNPCNAKISADRLTDSLR